MNTLKPLLICAVLAGIGYGVYVRINSGNDLPPPGAPQDWNAPEVQLGELGDASAPPSAPTTSGGSAAPWPANSGASAGEAPPFNAAPPAQQSAGAASPFAPPVVHGTNPAAQAAGAAPPFDAAAATPPLPGDHTSSEQPPLEGNANDRYAQSEPAAGDSIPVDRYQVAPAPVPDRYQSDTSPAVDRYATPETNPADRYPSPGQSLADSAAPADRYAVPQSAEPDTYLPPDGAAPEQYPPTASGAEPQANGTFAEVMEAARQDLEAGQMASALEQLSSWYNDPRLTPAEQQQLNQTLDQVAGSVVYSTQHLLEPPYEVQPGERLEDIAQRYNVPWQLLAKINGIDDPASLRPGERLKVVRGPFNAVVDLNRRELTLMLSNGSYAGRFPIGIGQDQPPREGSFTVSDKVVDPVYHGRNQVLGAGDQANPYGHRWIGLGTDLAIHGTDRAENVGRTDLPGSISLSPRDIEDVFDILATGSQVTIRR